MAKIRRMGRAFEALFLDRDGTLIVERGFLKDPKGVRLARGAVERLKRFTDRGTLLFVVTNQSGLARGYLTWDDVHAVNAEVKRRLAARGVPLHDVFVCPHYHEGSVPELVKRCHCRKPKPFFYRRALARHGIEPSRAAVIGDKWDDVGAGVALGATAVHVATGYGRRDRAQVVAQAPDAILARTLADALDRLLAMEAAPRFRTARSA